MAVIPHKARSNAAVEVGQRPTRYPIYPNLTEVQDKTAAPLTMVLKGESEVQMSSVSIARKGLRERNQDHEVREIRVDLGAGEHCPGTCAS